MKNKDLIQVLSDALEEMRAIDPNANVEIVNLSRTKTDSFIFENRKDSGHKSIEIGVYSEPTDCVQICLVWPENVV